MPATGVDRFHEYFKHHRNRALPESDTSETPDVGCLGDIVQIVGSKQFLSGMTSSVELQSRFSPSMDCGVGAICGIWGF